MRIRSFVLPALVGTLFACHSAVAVEPNAAEHSDAHQWAAAKFQGKPISLADHGYLLPQLKSGSLEKNTRQKHTLLIADKFFVSGIHCPSLGTVNVHLPAGAKQFTALIGVDSNDVAYYSSLGRGQVVVSVEVKGKEIYRSPVMHEGLAPIPIDLKLGGASDFTLRLSGVSTGTEWDQADIADATVVLSDGKSVELSDLPIAPLQKTYSADPPFSFSYAGAKSSDFLQQWHVEETSKELDTERSEYTRTYRDPATGLEVRCVGIEYHDFPTVDWTVYFKNNGSSPTPILENIQALDTRFERSDDGEFILHHSKGAPATANDYEPYETPLKKNAEQSLSAEGGRPSNRDLPYFNLAWPGGGAIIVVGWPGQWAAKLARDDANGIQIRVGQELTHFRLLPGEEVRTPRIVMQFWQGEWLRSQNIWRRWMEAHNMPHPNGKLPPPQLAGNTSREYIEMTEATDRDENAFIDMYVAKDLKPDYFWMDAGWYINNGSWTNTGTWEVDPKRYPNGLRAVSDHAHSKGIKTIVWFEPERVTKKSWLFEHHPEWLLTIPTKPDEQDDDVWRLLDLGNPQALDWLTNHIDKLIVDQGIDLYRQDFNMDPLNYWRRNDAPDRQGITEIRYVNGYLAYWDELQRRHPNMLIDSCASGGRRNDIETMRRAVPLLRSDYLMEPGEPISQQMHTYGISFWIPFFGTGISGKGSYIFRSQMTPASTITWDLRRSDLDEEKLRTMVRQWRAVSANYYGDFYPLTSYSLTNDVWAAMQFDRAAEGEGFVEIFRRSKSPYETARFKLQGLDAKAHYAVTNLDSAGSQELSGEELIEKGIEVQLKQTPDSALLMYKRVDSTTH